MTQVPARLVYDDGTGQTLIGEFRPSNPSKGNISTLTIEEEARNYRRIIIEGGPPLRDNMPVTLSEFGSNEPEIKLQIDENNDGNYTDRLRVYPEESGTTDDKGRYKNKNLWGFKKYYGEDSVNTGTLTNTDLTAAVQNLLPSGYDAEYPGDITAPSISEYSYRGARQQGFNELQRQYDHFILFTDETNGSGNIRVLVQPTGYGGTQKSLVRGQDAFTYDYWKQNDLKNVVSRVNVIGTDGSGNEISETFQAGSNTGDPEVDTYLTGLNDPDRKVFKRIHVDYPITVSDAEEIARGILDPSGREHGAIEASIDVNSNLNQSIGLLDSSRGIDDVYTVVKQKDYLHEGVTYYSFEFEHEATDKQRDKWREHDSERAKIYPGGSTDVGNQGAGTLENDNTTADVSASESNTSPNVTGSTSNANTSTDYDFGVSGPVTAGGSLTTTATVPTGNFSSIDWYFITVNIQAQNSNSGNSNDDTLDLKIENTSTGNILFNETDLNLLFGNDTTSASRTYTVVESGADGGDTIEAEISNYTGGALIDLTVDSVEEHDHGDGTLGADSHNHSVSASDSGHGGSSSGLEHLISGSTAQQLINILQEVKQDR